MSKSINYYVHGRIKIKGEQAHFDGDEILYVSVRDSLRYDAECIELGSTHIRLQKGQILPIRYQCPYDPNKAHMKFDEIKSIPGAITILASIERGDQLLYTNYTDVPLADEVNIELVKVE